MAGCQQQVLSTWASASVGIGWHRSSRRAAASAGIGGHRSLPRLASVLLSGAAETCFPTSRGPQLRAGSGRIGGRGSRGFIPIGAVLEARITGWGSVVSPIADRAQKKGPGVGSPGPGWALLRSWVSVNVDRDVLSLVMGSTGSIAQDAVDARCPLPCLLRRGTQDLPFPGSLART